MRFFFDATVLEIPATGIAKTTLRLYRECLALNASFDITAVHRKALSTRPPDWLKETSVASFLPKNLWRSLALPRFIRREGPDIVHFPWNGQAPKMRTRALVLTTLHDVLPLVIPDYFKSAGDEERYRNKVLADIDRSDLLFTVSDYSRDEIVKNFKPRKEVVVIPHGPTLEAVSEGQPEVPLKNGYFLYVGGYDKRKGLIQLLRAFLDLHATGRLRTKLILTGSRIPFSREFETILHDLIQKGITEEKGYIPDSELVSLYRGAKALIYPSKYEGFGLPPLEAMSLGCPVLTTRHSAIAEVCGEAVLYADPDNAGELGRAVVLLDGDDNLRADLTARGMRQAARYSWGQSAALFMEAVTRGLSEKRRTHS